MAASSSDALASWQLISRLGEAQILLPAMLAAAAWIAARRQAGRLAGVWLGGTALAALVTTASKVAFIGFGIGHAALDFTGISGHAMFAAAVLPVVLRLAEGSLPPRWHGAGVLVGYALAALVAWSRVVLGVHSWAEVFAGSVLGVLASATALWLSHAPRMRVGVWVPALLLGWGALTLVAAPPSRTHDWVTAWSLAISGRAEPYTRQQMRRAWRERQSLPQP